VIPERAEWTTTGRKPSASRSCNTAATFFQLVTEETLVPPNLSTTHEDKLGVAPAVEFANVIEDPIRDAGELPDLLCRCASAAAWAFTRRPARQVALESRREFQRAPTLLFFFEIFQFFLQATLGQNVLEFAPRCLALFRVFILIWARPSIDKAIERLFLFVAFRDEIIVEIEVVVVSLHHVHS
jgi:hypothetical protein